MSFDAQWRDDHDVSAAFREPLRHPNAPFHCAPRPATAGTRSPFVKALVCAGVAYLTATALALGTVFLVPLADLTSHVLGDALAGALAFFFLPTIVPGLVTGTIVSQLPQSWSVPRIAGLFLLLFLLAATLQALSVI